MINDRFNPVFPCKIFSVRIIRMQNRKSGPKRMRSIPSSDNMQVNKSHSLRGYIKLILVSFLLISISACFGKGKSAEEEASPQAAVDMTRPPTTIKDAASKEAEGNPDETVPFEEWKKNEAKDDDE